MKKLVFLCGARDFHAMDWYKSAKAILPDNEIVILTDLIAGEGYKKLISNDDNIHRIILLDKFLFRKQSKIAHIWRNILKLLVFPFQVKQIKKFSNSNPDAIYHAHSMYYLFLAWAAKIPYIGTPQGSDILIKPYKSYLYRHFTIKSLRGAKAITVDSLKMKTKIKELANIEAFIIQNGIDLRSIKAFNHDFQNIKNRRDRILSIRGLTRLYRIKELLLARNSSEMNNSTPITFIYPFSENQYLKEINPLFARNDIDLNRVDRMEMYKLLTSAKLVISIPSSDSSPRSVYESIFCGAAVAITYHPYYDNLPECMKSRIILINLNQTNWFDHAVAKANKIVKSVFIPTEDALNLFDQEKSFRLVEKLLFDL